MQDSSKTNQARFIKKKCPYILIKNKISIFLFLIVNILHDFFNINYTFTFFLLSPYKLSSHDFFIFLLNLTFFIVINLYFKKQ